MKKLNFKGLTSAAPATSTTKKVENNSDKLLFTIPLQLLEVKYYESKSFYIPAYKVKPYKSNIEDTFWLTDGRIAKKEGEKIEDIIRQETTFIYGGIPTIIDLANAIINGKIDDAIAESNGHIEYLNWRRGEGISVAIPQDKVLYVGIDVWQTKECMKYCISGSNWFYRKCDNDMHLILDEIALQLMFEKENAA